LADVSTTYRTSGVFVPTQVGLIPQPGALPVPQVLPQPLMPLMTAPWTFWEFWERTALPFPNPGDPLPTFTLMASTSDRVSIAIPVHERELQ